MELSNIFAMTTEQIVEILLTKNDLVKPDGLLTPIAWELRKKLGIILCVDSIAMRINEDEIPREEILLIKRNSGPFKGKWCAVGGTIAVGESVYEAVARHWKVDLGCEIKKFDFKKPFYFHQHMPPAPDGTIKEGFCPEPTKSSMAPFYIIEVENEPTKLGESAYGQEASTYSWFNLKNLPGESDFAYGFHEVCLEVLGSSRKYTWLHGF